MEDYAMFTGTIITGTQKEKNNFNLKTIEGKEKSSSKHNRQHRASVMHTAL